MKHCEFNFTTKAVHCIYCELKDKQNLLKGQTQKKFHAHNTLFYFFFHHNVGLKYCGFKSSNAKSLFLFI